MRVASFLGTRGTLGMGRGSWREGEGSLVPGNEGDPGCGEGKLEGG